MFPSIVLTFHIQDWFHESCCNLREKPETEAEAPAAPEGDVDDAASDASSSGLPPPMIRASDYDSFVCAACVRKIPTLLRYAGTEGCLMAIRDAPSLPWKVLAPTQDPVVVFDEGTPTSEAPVVPSKRALSPSAREGEREAKRPRACLAPPLNPVAQQILADPSSELGAGDVFLTEDFRERWCRCEECLPSLEANAFLLKEEETYEPPEDPDSGLSLEELGMRALNRLPRERAIDGIHAFNAMRYVALDVLRAINEQIIAITWCSIFGRSRMKERWSVMRM